ncbi:MAG: STAS domain-containing protein [Vicinamibacterales bacterium]
MQLDITPLNDHLVKVTLAGRLDTQGVDRIETRFIAAMVPAGKSAVVDISAVEFLASLGIRMLVAAARGLKMRKARLAVYGAGPAVSQVFEVAALGQLMSICSSEAEAMAAVGAPGA